MTQRSAVIEAPKRFDLVGLAGERRPLEVRARAADGAWSEWAEIANGDPLYVGGASFAQVRARGWRPEGRLHYVNVSGTTSAVSSALTSARRALSGAIVSASALVLPEAEAAVGKPSFVTRREWGANRDNGGCHPRTSPSYGRVKAVAVHHTVSVNDYSRAEAPGNRARHLPLPPQRQRLERHRLQRARRSLRHPLCRAVREGSTGRSSAPRRRASTRPRPGSPRSPTTPRGLPPTPPPAASPGTSPGSCP